MALTVRRLRRSQASRRFLRRLIAPRLMLLRREGTKLLVFKFHGYPFPKLQGISLTYPPFQTLARLSRIIIIKTSERLPHSTSSVYLLILNINIGEGHTTGGRSLLIQIPNMDSPSCPRPRQILSPNAQAKALRRHGIRCPAQSAIKSLFLRTAIYRSTLFTKRTTPPW